MNTHQWNIFPKDAIDLQKKLQSEVRLVPLPATITTIAGVDVSMTRFSNHLYAGVVVMTYPECEVIEKAFMKDKITFPYIPGLLSFREIPSLLKCFEKLKYMPDVCMVDGQGIAHPRRLGIASHLGLILDLPTIGCAKSLLYGTVEGDGIKAIIRDPKTNEILGIQLKTKDRAKPIIISPGHKADIDSSCKIVEATLKGYRLPEPTRIAHRAVSEFRLQNTLS